MNTITFQEMSNLIAIVLAGTTAGLFVVPAIRKLWTFVGIAALVAGGGFALGMLTIPTDQLASLKSWLPDSNDLSTGWDHLRESIYTAPAVAGSCVGIILGEGFRRRA